jgi:NAD(P)-dependent dehydrogenase (short-subunit alcohol dehydrogenase family)
MPGRYGPGMGHAQELFDLSGKVALVTGGSRGLGREMVHAFAAAGADVIVASRRAEVCEQVAQEVRDEHGRKAYAIAANVSDWDQCDALVDAAYEQAGRVDVLVNNAGMSLLYDRLEHVDERMFDKVVALNLKGPFRLTANVGARMAGSGGGSVINITSIAARSPRPEYLPYAAAKAALNTLTEGFAHAFGPSVRVNTIQAGPFLTEISNAWDMPSFEARARERMALQRAGEPHEIVGAALYFASDASSFTTGAILRVDGGEQ